MEVQQELMPSRHPDELRLPSVPTHDLPLPQSYGNSKSLPHLQSLGLPTGLPTAPSTALFPHNANSIQPRTVATLSPTNHESSYTHFRQHGDLSALRSPETIDSGISSERRGHRSLSVMSFDDPETREAAETLSGLRNVEFFGRSPPIHQPNVKLDHDQKRDLAVQPQSVPMQDEDLEPILSLLTSSHPWLGGTINGSLTAYNTTMAYSPAFIRTSAAFIERNIGSPVANGLGTVSRRTGVENSVRRYLSDRIPSDGEREAYPTNKRRRRGSASSREEDVEKGMILSPTSTNIRSRTNSETSNGESLPAYDENRAPSYEENAPLRLQQRPEHWSTRFVITTSGLGAALNQMSLKSLRYCLGLLHHASDHLTSLMRALRVLLEEYEQSVSGASQSQSRDQQQQGQPPYSLTAQQEAASQALAERIRTYSSDILATLKNVTDVVSQYAGGALPANAGALVRRQLMSMPMRWRVAEQSTASREGGSETVRTGEKWLAFAIQGCDMIAQVILVMKGTVESAEGWLDKMGRRSSTGSGHEARSSDGTEKRRLERRELDDDIDVVMSEKN